VKTIFLQFNEIVIDSEFSMIQDQIKHIDPDLKIILLPHNLDPKVCVEPLTKLEEFAKSAMESIFSGPGAQMVADRDERYNEDNWAEVVALNSFEMAEAMLKEAEKRQS